MLMQNNFSKCREWVPRGTSQHKWRWLTTLLLILTLGIGQMWGTNPADTVTVHSPGKITGTNLVSAYGRSYEVFFSDNASLTQLLVGSNTSANTLATGENKWCCIGANCGNTSNSISTAFTNGEFVCNVKTSNHKALRVQSLEKTDKVIAMVVSGYDSIATLDKDEVEVYAEIWDATKEEYGTRSKLTAAKTTSVSSHNKRAYALNASKRYRLTIAYHATGSTNKTLYGFSLCIPSTSSTKYTVTFNNNGHGGTAPAAQGNISSGGKATEPTPAPTDDDYDFGGWWNNSNWEATGAAQWNFSSSTVTKDTTLYAKWTLKPASTCTTPTVDATFTATESEIEIAWGDDDASTTLTYTKGDNTSDPTFAVTKGGAATTDASVLAGVFTATKAGTYTVTATQAEDGTYCQVVKQVTITVTEEAAPAVDCSTIMGTIYKFETKSSGLGTGAVCALKNTDYPMTTSNSLKNLQGGTLTARASSDNSGNLAYNNNSFKFTGGSAGWLILNLECEIKAGDIIRYIKTNSGNISVRHTSNTTSTDAFNLTGNSANIQTIAIPSAFAGKSTIYLIRGSNTAEISYFEIVRPYTVTLAAGEGATVTPTSISANANEVVALPHPVKDGSLFTGWYDGETKVSDAYTVTKNVTLTAHYSDCPETGSIYKFSVLSDLTDGVCAEVNTFDVTVGNYLTALEGGTLTGYNNNSKLSIAHQNAFQLTDNSKSYLKVDLDCALAKCDKFKTTVADNSIAITAEATRSTDFTIADGTEEITYVPEALVGKKTFYIWRGGGNASISYLEVIRPVTHTIKFDADGGTDVDSILVETGTAATAPTAPTKDKYDFVKWVVKSTSADYDWTANVTGDLELKAIWAPWPTMTLVAGEGATGDPVATQYKAGTEITVPAKPEDFSKGTNVFDGWTYSPAVSVNEGKFEMPSTNLTLTAVWVAPSNYDVRFFQGYGEPDVQIGTTQSITVNSFATAPATDPTREGYAFLGWSYDASAEHIVNVAEYAITAATDFTAMWQKVWTVSFDGDDVVVNDGAKVSSPNSPSQAGKVFLGWYNGENKYDFSANVTANLALTSKWADVDPNHFVYAYNDDFHYDGVLYKTPEGKVDAGAGSPNIALTNTAYSLFSGAAGITSVVVNNGIYDSKSGAEQGVTALVKLNTTSTSNLTVTIKAGYTAVMKVKMGSWNVATAAPTVTFKKGEDAISYTGTMDGKASDQSYAELTYNLEAGTYVMTTATKTLYFSSIDIQATALPTYAVTYAANGGEGTMTDANEYYEGAEVTLLENTFAPASGFMWSGWAVTGNVSGDPIAVSEGKFTMPAEAVTVTAQWTDVSKVVKIVETDAKYDNFADAIAAVEAGQTIQLIQNCEYSTYWDLDGSALTGTKTVTLDLNGHDLTYTGTKRGVQVSNGGTLVLMDGTATVAPTIDLTTSPMARTAISYTSGTFDSKDGMCALAGSEIIINSGRYLATEGVILVKGPAATATVNDGVLICRDNSVIGGNGTNNADFRNYVMNIHGGILYGEIFSAGYASMVVYHPNVGELNIDGGILVSTNGPCVVTRGGETNITGGTLVALGSGSGKCGDASLVLPAVGIAVDFKSAYPGVASTDVAVSGTVDVTGQAGAVEAVYAAATPTATEESKVNISGGSFNTELTTDLCAPGFIPAPADPMTGKYSVQPKEALCLIKAELSAPDNNTVATPTITVGCGNAEVGGNVKGAKTHETIVGYKFNADGAYLYVTLANGSFQAGDSVEVYMTYGAKALAVYPHFNSAALATSAASASAALGKNYVVLAENADTLYIARKDNNGWNPNVAYIAVYRVADPMLQKFEMAGAAGVINEAAKTVTVELPYNTDVTALTPTKINYVSNGDPTAPATAVSPTGAQNFTNPVVYTITDKDGSTTAYTVTVNIAAPSNDATLSALSYGDPATAIALEDGVYDYVVNLAKGTTVVPGLTATANEPTLVQSVVVQNAATFENYEATSTVLVTAQDNTTKLTYTVHFNVAHAVAALVDVTENTTWDWSLVTSRADGSDIDEIISGKNHGPRVATADGLILANYVLGGNNWDKIEGNNTAYAIRNAANKYYQGASLHMHTTVSGYLKIHARNDGSAMKLKVQNAGRDMEVSALGNWKDYTVYVVAGDVTIYNVPEEDNKPMRIDYMEFTVDETPDHTRDIATLNIGNIGTLCVDHNVPVGGMVGATFYQIAGKDEYGKIAFDEVDSLVAGEPYIFQSHTNLLTLYYGNVTADEAVVKNGMHGYLGDANYTLDIDESNKTDIMYIANNRLWNCEDLVGIGLTVVPNRCYIVYSAVSDLDNNSTPNNVRKRVFIGGASAPQTATGLENLVGGEQAQKLMINGQLYILRGEKLFDATGRLVK